MKAATLVQQRLRERSEHFLRLAAMEDQRRRHPSGTRPPAFPPGGGLWRHVFVPLYRHVPWHVKARAMELLNMTASGWAHPPRRAREPWRPPAGGPPPPPSRSPGEPGG